MVDVPITPLIFGAFSFLLVVFFVFALRRARRRRFAELEERESPTPRDSPRPGSSLKPEASPVSSVAKRADPTSATPTDESADAATRRDVGAVEAPTRTEPELYADAATVEGEEADELEERGDEPADEAPSPPSAATPPEEVQTPSVRDEDRLAISAGLQKTRESFLGKINALFRGGKKIDASVLDELEEVLLTADVGVSLTMDLIDQLRDELNGGGLQSSEDVRSSLRAKMMAVVDGRDESEDPLDVNGPRPRVILFVGVNGVGKTTTIGKIAAKLTGRGHSVVLAAGDTFRAAAAEQLEVWAERSGSRIIRGEEGTDPASVVFNAVQHGRDAGADYVLADTAGRLHTKSELMDEIKKVKRAATKARDGAPDQTWLVLDATTGQNGLQQATEFHNTLELSGVILTKLDGTAKGGVVVAIASALGIPVRFVGVGEQVQDLRTFDAKQFVDALFDAA
ncbi:MAG: signal recognition particle-docking protein FtsY [Myxococcota bacterium]